jgi:decaprenylphospho-beta-D-ribofuranose 2-oxidase
MPSSAHVVDVDTEHIAAVAVAHPSDRGVIARGLGRSYGDAAQASGGLVLDMTAFDRVLSFDPATGEIEVEAGVSLDTLIRRFLPLGWFVPVTPGTRSVTVGGAIAADIHGKNHHSAGTFGSHVRSLDLLLADGSVRTLSPTTEAAAFWATVGGMGLTGVILRARFALKPVPSAHISVDTRRARDLDDLMQLQVEFDATHPYSVAWIDCLTRGASMGRGVLTAGRFAEVDELPSVAAHDPWRIPTGPTVTAPRAVPSGLLNRWSVAAFNELWFRKAPRSRDGEIQTTGTFFHPLDGVTGWNTMYGRHGFLQYQFVVPDERADVVRTAIERLADIRAASFLAVLKRFGAANPAPLSFPMPGWTLALDIPTQVDGLAATLDALDELVAEAGGRVYLAKDSRTDADLLKQMYPRLPEWASVRDDLDPHRTFRSDLSRRLSL